METNYKGHVITASAYNTREPNGWEPHVNIGVPDGNNKNFIPFRLIRYTPPRKKPTSRACIREEVD